MYIEIKPSNNLLNVYMDIYDTSWLWNTENTYERSLGDLFAKHWGQKDFFFQNEPPPKIVMKWGNKNHKILNVFSSKIPLCTCKAKSSVLIYDYQIYIF